VNSKEVSDIYKNNKAYVNVEGGSEIMNA